MNTKSCLLAASLFALCAGSAPAADATSPDSELASFKVADGFEVNLFASDPDVTKPIGINFDADGRLWVVSSSIYPQLKPGDVPNDKVYVLEDTTHSGKADRSTIFAEGLFIPTGIAPGDGGCYVANSTEMLFLKDTTGSGKADLRRPVLSGFGTEDTHHIIHAFRWGPDGRLYFNQSIYIHSHVETPWGTRSLLGSGTWRFRPETMQLDVYCRGQVNPWGIVWDNWGQTFETDGAGGEGIVFAFPGSAFQSAVGYDKVLPGMNHGSPKYAGLEIVDGSAMPESWRGDFLTNDFRAHRICHFHLTESGSGFVSKQLPDFITTANAAFRPIDIKMGPDGAIYIADWYNPIINHGEVDFRDARRDHAHGRIWRVTAKGQAPLPPQKLSSATIPQLLDALRSPEHFIRDKARGALRERGAAAVAPALAQWVKAIRPRSESADHDRLEALWTAESIDLVDPPLLSRALAAKDPHARAAAVRVLSHWAAQIPEALDLLGKAIDDEHPRVRLEAVRALAAINSPEAIVVAERALAHPMDANLQWALTQTARDLQPIWMPAFTAGKLTTWASPTHLSRALADVKAPEALGVLVEQLKSGHLTDDQRKDLIDLIAVIDPQKGPATLFDLASGPDATDAAGAAHMLDAVARASGSRPPADAADRLAPLIDSKETPLAAAAMRLAGAWRLQKTFPTLADIAQSSQPIDPLRRKEAFDAIAAYGASSSDLLQKLANDASAAPAVRAMAIGGLASIDARAAAPLAADLLAAGGADADPSVIIGAFVKRAGGGAALASALAGKSLPSDTARLALRYLQSLGGEETPLNDLLRKAAGLSSGPTRLSADQMKQMVADVLARGNAHNGEKIFRSRETGCFQCHSIGGAGGQLAPDLRAIGAASPIDYLVDSVLDPNKAIKDGYQGFAIATKDGDVFSGIKIRQDEKEIILRDATHDMTIPVAFIRQQKDIGSLMPTGLADTLTHQEFCDLIRFLSELGKPGDYGPDTAAIVRRWRVLQFVADYGVPSDLPLALSEDNSNWQPAYALVSGELPPASFTTEKGKKISWARAELEATGAARARLLLNDARGLDLWIDGKHATLTADLSVDLPAGVHALVFRVDFTTRGKVGLRLEVQDAAGSAGHVQPVTGR